MEHLARLVLRFQFFRQGTFMKCLLLCVFIAACSHVLLSMRTLQRDQPLRFRPISDHVVSGNAVADHAVADHAVSDHEVSDHGASNHAVSDYGVPIQQTLRSVSRQHERINLQRSPATHPSAQLIRSLQAKLSKILQTTLAGHSSCVLLDMPGHENKGDSAISVGELNALHSINMTIQRFHTEYTKKEVYVMLKAELDPQLTVVLAQGGGNIGAWPQCDNYRAVALKVFNNFKYVILSQSVRFLDQSGKHLASVQAQYKEHHDMTLLLRDEPSFNFSRSNLQPARPVLAPDMAFGMGPVFQYFPPTLDVIWINRQDKERAIVCKPKFPPTVTFLVMDWLTFRSSGGRHIVDSGFMKTHAAFLFLQRGKVVVTDRLHGYILATILGIPTVIIDNNLKKLTNFRNTWTSGRDNAVVAKDVADAVAKALALLATVSKQTAPGF